MKNFYEIGRWFFVGWLVLYLLSFLPVMEEYHYHYHYLMVSAMGLLGWAMSASLLLFILASEAIVTLWLRFFYGKKNNYAIVLNMVFDGENKKENIFYFLFFIFYFDIFCAGNNAQ